MSLSNKRILVDEYFAHYTEEDVAEAVRELKKSYFIDNKVLWADVIMEIDRIFGEKLI